MPRAARATALERDTITTGRREGSQLSVCEANPPRQPNRPTRNDSSVIDLGGARYALVYQAALRCSELRAETPVRDTRR